MSALRRLFNLGPAEAGPVLSLWTTYLVVVMGLRVGWGTTTALFLEHFGARWLPAGLAARAVVSVIATTVYASWADRIRHGRLMVWILAIGAAAVALTLSALAVSEAAGVLALYVVARAVSTVFFLHWGTYLADVFQRRDAKRLFPGIFSGARVGGLVGGLALATLPDFVGTGGLIVLFALALGAAALLIGTIRVNGQATTATKPPASAEPRRGRLRGLREGLRVVRRSRFLLWTATCTVLLICTRNVIVVVDNAVFEAHFGDAESLTRFFGVYALVAGIVALLLQVGVAGRLIARLGIARPNLLYALSLAASALGLTIFPALPTAIAGRFAEHELRTSLKVPVHNLLYTAVPADVRARARAVSSGLTVPVATIAVNLALLPLIGHLRLEAVAAMGLVFGVAYVFATARQNRAFIRALGARAAAEAVGDDDLATTPTPTPRADIDGAVATLGDAAADRVARFQALSVAPAHRLERPTCDLVAESLTTELDVASKLLAFSTAGSDRDRGRLLAAAADERARYVLALIGAWAAPRMRFAVLGDLTRPLPGVEKRLEPVREVLAELLSPRTAARFERTLERLRDNRQRDSRRDPTPPLSVLATALGWNDRWVAAGVGLALANAESPGAAVVRGEARDIAAATGLRTVPTSPPSENHSALLADSPWHRLAVDERVATFLRYPLFRDLTLPGLESLARAASGDAIGPELFGEHGEPLEEPDTERIRLHLEASVVGAADD